jgi:DNA repair exonuclease SbcCD ATPase subunit
MHEQEHDLPSGGPAIVRVEIHGPAEVHALNPVEGPAVRDETHVRELFRHAAELDERERRLAERETALEIAPVSLDGERGRELGELAGRLEERERELGEREAELGNLELLETQHESVLRRERRLSELELQVRTRLAEVDRLEGELEARSAILQTDLELREDELDRRESELEERERRLGRKESDLGAYVAQVQSTFGRSVPAYS